MLETLTNLKNNKVKQPAAQAQGVESVSRLRKFLGGLHKKHHGRIPTLIPHVARPHTLDPFSIFPRTSKRFARGPPGRR